MCAGAVLSVYEQYGMMIPINTFSHATRVLYFRNKGNILRFTDECCHFMAGETDEFANRLLKENIARLCSAGTGTGTDAGDESGYKD